MLSGLSSYLFGASSEEEHPAATTRSAVALAHAAAAERLKLTPADDDDDWTLVNKSSRGGSPLRLEDNPMENLLIEHPSMSVYQQRGRPNSCGTDSEHESDSEEAMNTEAAPQSPQPAPSQASNRVASRANAQNHRALATSATTKSAMKRRKMAQTSQKRKEHRQVSFGKIERSNKVQHQNSSAKVQRRNKKIQFRTCSSRNNDRKCQ